MAKNPNIPKQACPQCAYPQDTAENPHDEADTPTVGDVTICLNCGSILVFGDGLLLKKPSPDDEVQIYLEASSEALRTIKGAQAFIKRRGRFWPAVAAVIS